MSQELNPEEHHNQCFSGINNNKNNSNNNYDNGLLSTVKYSTKFDFSSAFDIIDHSILVHHLHTDFGFAYSVPQSFSSYLTYRTHYVYLIIVLLLLLYTQVFLMVQFLALCFSPCILSLCLPLLTHILSYTIHLLNTYYYICLLLLTRYNIYIIIILYIYILYILLYYILHSMQSCLCDVKAWATADMLRLNDNKTELMLVTFKRTKHLHNLPTSITIGNAQIPFKQSMKNFGFTLDCHLTMNAHVSNIARTCYSELSHLRSIRRFLTSTATTTLVSALVLSRIDYCFDLF